MIFLAIGSGFAQSAPFNQDEPISTTVCEVVKNPSRFDGKLIRFHASFVSDGLEHSVLMQRGCKQGIVPYSPSDDKQRPDLDAFDRAVRTGAPGTADKNVAAVFVGHLVWKRPSLILELEGVSDVKVTTVRDKR